MNRELCISKNHGFNLIELMVAMAIGLFLIAGVFTAYLNGRGAQATVDNQVAMVDNARFALETIAADLRQAGVYGRINFANTAGTTKVKSPTLNNVNIPGQCQINWVINWAAAVAAFNNNPYGACLTDYSQGDVIEMRYTLQTPIAALNASTIYVNSDVRSAEIFQGTASPNLSAAAQNYAYVVNAYYIAAFSDNPNDGIPSLRRVALQPDGTVTNQVLLSGIENMRIQVGLGSDTDNDGRSDSFQYVDAQNVASWSDAETVQVWLVVRSPAVERGLNTAQNNVSFGNGTINFPNDGVRRRVVSTVAMLRNI